MTDAASVWGVCMLALLAAIGIEVRRRRRVPTIRHQRLERSPTHQAQVIALVDWLQDERIVRAILQTGTGTPEGLRQTLDAIEAMEAGEVQATIGILLRKREVRQVVAGHVQKTTGITRVAAMQALLEWAEPVRQEIGA